MTQTFNTLVPELWCHDFDASFTFYTDVLGFDVLQHREGSHHAYLGLGDAQLMISNFEQDGTWETGPFERPLGRGINFSIQIEDALGMQNALAAKGVAPFVPYYTIEYWRPGEVEQRGEFAVQDPDGYLLRFTQTLGVRSAP